MLATAPYAGLTPETVLDALEAAGLRGDGRLLALNSYENRVYQVWLEDGSSVVAKFYRPARWSDAQIREEHAFVAELAEREIPAVPPLAIDGRTLLAHAGFRFAVYPRRGGRTPELEQRDTLEWIGRFLGRIHAVGAARPFAERPALDADAFGREPRDWLLAHDFVPPDLPDRRYYIFGQGGGKRVADELGVDFLGEVPIDPRVAEGGDRGRPILIHAPDSDVSRAIREITGMIVRRLSVLADSTPPIADANITWVSTPG